MQEIPKFLEDPGNSERIGKKSERIPENTKKFERILENP